MRRINIETLCDACDLEHAPESPAEHSLVIALGGRPKSIDLCDRHAKVMVQPLRDLLESHGADPEDTPLAAPTPKQHGDGGGPWICPTCGKHLNWRKSAITHMVLKHELTEAAASQAIPPKSGDAMTCEICGYLAAGAAGLGSHKSFLHGDGTRAPAPPIGNGPVICPRCQHESPSRDAAKKHARDMHNASLQALLHPDRAIACSICGYLATGPQGLTSHKNRIHGE